MKWIEEEDIIICKFYLKYKDLWRNNVSKLLEELNKNNLNNHSEASVKMRVANFEYLDTGNGLSHASKLSQKVFNDIKGHMHP